MSRLRLPAMLAAAALGLVGLAPTASAAPTALVVAPLPSIVYIGNPVPVSVVYTCSGVAEGTSANDPVTLGVAIQETRGSDGDYYALASGGVAAVCDGDPHAVVVPVTTSINEILDGPATLDVSLHDPTTGQVYASIQGQQVTIYITTPVPTPTPSPTPTPTPTVTPSPTPTSTPTPPPAPVKASVSLTANASPETVTKGKKITVTGTIRRDGEKVKLSTALEFQADGDDYAKVKSVTSSSKGELKTTVTANRSGTFRYTYAGNATTKPGASSGDHILVVKPLPKPKTYKNCTELVKVYPHGVGKSGAHDKGGDVTDFTRDNKTYAKNKKSDRDKDGIACER